jgi:hypothetical protein
MKKILLTILLFSTASLSAWNFSLSNGAVVQDPSFSDWKSISLSASSMTTVAPLQKEKFCLSTDSPTQKEQEPEERIVYNEDVKPLPLTPKALARLERLQSPWSRINWTISMGAIVSDYYSSFGTYAHGSTQLNPDLFTNFSLGVEEINGRKGYSDGKIYHLQGGFDWFPTSSTRITFNIVTDYFDQK